MDLGKTQKDYAVYLPAISSFYVKQLEKVERVTESRVPAGFEKGHEGMDFLRPDAYFHYPKGLYSAGHAQLDIDKTNKDEPMIQGRDRNTSMILGDSGGFQIPISRTRVDLVSELTVRTVALIICPTSHQPDLGAASTKRIVKRKIRSVYSLTRSPKTLTNLVVCQPL